MPPPLFEAEPFVAGLCLALCSAACSSGGGGSAAAAAADAAPPSASPAPECFSDAAAPPVCLTGTASASAFAAPATLRAGLFTTVPSQSPVATEALGSDGAWAFDLTALDAGSDEARYFVEITAQFGSAASIARTVGPLSPGAPAAVSVLPVQIAVIESRVAGGGVMQVRSASAKVFDPSTGAEILDGSAIVTLAVGPTSIPLTWDDAGMMYVAEPSPPPTAEATYSVTIAQRALGSSPTNWQVTAEVPASDGVITSPPADASVAAGPLTVTWQAVPGIDYVQLEAFEIAGDGGASDASAGTAGTDGGGPSYSLVYASPAPDGPAVTQETIPAAALAQPGPYLINVISSQANCPVMESGCVYAGTVAAETIAITAGAGP